MRAEILVCFVDCSIPGALRSVGTKEMLERFVKPVNIELFSLV